MEDEKWKIKDEKNNLSANYANEAGKKCLSSCGNEMRESLGPNDLFLVYTDVFAPGGRSPSMI